MFDILCFTSRALCPDRAAFLCQIERLAAQRPAAIILREKDLTPTAYEALAREVLAICRRYGTSCTLHHFARVARNLGCDRLHMPLAELERMSDPVPQSGRTMLSVALPKGRLGDKVYDLLAGVGYGCPENYADTRKLVVENRKAGIRYFLVKPSDVAIYVEHGAADIGIVGKDILTESGADVYELLDTGLGKCRMCVAGPRDFAEDPSRTLRVATKFVNIAKRYYAAQGRDIDIIQLNGSIELAPILGLSDVIVDIVETGTTLRENDLKVLTEFMPISARFIANRASYQFKHREIETLLKRLREVTEQ